MVSQEDFTDASESTLMMSALSHQEDTLPREDDTTCDSDEMFTANSHVLPEGSLNEDIPELDLDFTKDSVILPELGGSDLNLELRGTDLNLKIRLI